MTRKDFLKGWLLLVSQPCGLRYSGENDIATVQAEFYWTQFNTVAPAAWWSTCERFASCDSWKPAAS